MLCSVCIHARVCEKLEDYRDPLHFEDATTGEVKCDYFDAIMAETSFQEDLDFFVNDCTMAQLHALRAAVEARINEAIESKIITMPCGCTFEGGTGTAPDGTECGECHPGFCDTCPYLKKLEDKCGD